MKRPNDDKIYYWWTERWLELCLLRVCVLFSVIISKQMTRNWREKKEFNVPDILWPINMWQYHRMRARNLNKPVFFVSGSASRQLSICWRFYQSYRLKCILLPYRHRKQKYSVHFLQWKFYCFIRANWVARKIINSPKQPEPRLYKLWPGCSNAQTNSAKYKNNRAQMRAKRSF